MDGILSPTIFIVVSLEKYKESDIKLCLLCWVSHSFTASLLMA